MAQQLATPRPTFSKTPVPTYSRWIDTLVLLAAAALVTGTVAAARRWTAPMNPHLVIDLSPTSLPLYAGLSTLRMTAAYLLSLVFSVLYARVTATSRATERVMLPVLDTLQSIPILSFMPGVVLGLVALFPRSNVGLELAAIVLIFTSQAWNMAFGFYQSLVTIPADMREAATIFRLNAWQRFVRLELPFGTIPLVWNSMLSWAGGWFFLMAAEQFTLGSTTFQLPGLGSYLQAAANAGDVGALLLGLAALVVVIALLDQLLWRPLVAWSERFKMEQAGSAGPPTSPVLTALRRSAVVAWYSQRAVGPAMEALDRLSGSIALNSPRSRGAAKATSSDASQRSLVRTAATAAPLVVAGVAVAWGVYNAALLAVQLSLSSWGTVGLGALATLARTAAALVIGAAWTVPVGVAIGLNQPLAQRAQPIIQMVASIPATALFPALLLLLLGLPGGLNVAAVALMLLGTQWYILFNVIAGTMAIPTELLETATVFKLHGLRRWRLLLLPGILPYLITGMITATGGAWNASIVSEFVSFGGSTHSTLGLGSLIAQAAASGDFALLLVATLVMGALVVAINRLWWRRLYAVAIERYRLD